MARRFGPFLILLSLLVSAVVAAARPRTVTKTKTVVRHQTATTTKLRTVTSVKTSTKVRTTTATQTVQSCGLPIIALSGFETGEPNPLSYSPAVGSSSNSIANDPANAHTGTNSNKVTIDPSSSSFAGTLIGSEGTQSGHRYNLNLYAKAASMADGCSMLINIDLPNNPESPPVASSGIANLGETYQSVGVNYSGQSGSNSLIYTITLQCSSVASPNPAIFVDDLVIQALSN